MKLASAEVSFNHYKDKGITTCTVVAKNKVFQGTAKCSVHDNFCRKTGRKISLVKAMAHTKGTLSKVQRRNVWEAYKNMTAVPRW